MHPIGTTCIGVSPGPLAFARRARTAAGAFSPPDIAGLHRWHKANGTLWQDSARTTPASADGDPVGAWDDESGNGGHQTQATDSLRPTLQTGEVNSLPVVRFDGSDDYLSGSITADASFTAFFVVKKQSAAGAASRAVAFWGGVAELYTNTGDGSGWLWYDGTVRVFGGTATNWTCITLKHTDTSNMTPYLNGTAGTTFNPADSVSTQTALNLSRFDEGDYDVAEVILYDTALSDTDRGNVEAYLSSKYALGF